MAVLLERLLRCLVHENACHVIGSAGDDVLVGNGILKGDGIERAELTGVGLRVGS